MSIERLRALEKKWRGIGDAKHSKAEGPFAVESSKIANLCEGDLCHQMADELATLIAELGQEVGAEQAPVAYMEPVTFNAASPADFAEALRKWPDDYDDWFPVYSSPAHTSEARDAVSVEGTVVFKRSAGAGKNCVCCDGDHVYGRNIAYDTRAKRPDDTALDELVRGVISKPENEGKRIRISIEIIAGANDAAMRQEGE